MGAYKARGERSRSSGSCGASERWFTYKRHSMAPYLNSLTKVWRRPDLYCSRFIFPWPSDPNDCFVLFCTRYGSIAAAAVFPPEHYCCRFFRAYLDAPKNLLSRPIYFPTCSIYKFGVQWSGCVLFLCCSAINAAHRRHRHLLYYQWSTQQQQHTHTNSITDGTSSILEIQLNRNAM